MDENKIIIEEEIPTREAYNKYRTKLDSGEYSLEFIDDSRAIANVVKNERANEDPTIEETEEENEVELSDKDKARIDDLESKISEWNEELKANWGRRYYDQESYNDPDRYTDTDEAEVERRNLNELIQNAKREINEIKGINNDELNLPDPVEYLKSLKEIRNLSTYLEALKQNENIINELNKQIIPINLRIEKLKEEQKFYENDSNGEKREYKKIYDEYEKEIKKLENKKNKIQKDIEGIKEAILTKKEALPILSKGIRDLENEIRGIKRQISKLKIEISEITDSDRIPTEEITLSDGTKVKLSIIQQKYYKELDELDKTLKEKENLLEDFQQYYNLIDGNYKENSFKYSKEQNSDIMRFFHGQGNDHEGVQRDENGNIIGNVNRDDRRVNDEYFGFENRIEVDKKGKKGPERPGQDEPEGPEEPGPDDPEGPERPGPDDPEGPEEPGPDDPKGPEEPGPDDPEGPEEPGPDDPTPPQNGLVRSGLQIFRDEFNKMPEIKRRHTASERMPFYQTVLGVGGIVATATLGPLGLIPIALAPTLKPFFRLVTGQNKIEKQIADQFRDLERNNPNEFDRMVDYISEERIQDLKPNAVILRALHKVQTERTAKQLKLLQAESDGLEDQRDRILQKAQNNPDILSDTEKNNLAYITARLKQINEGGYGVDENGKEAKIEAEVERIQRRFKELKRGKDRVSQRYKGNLATRFNIFAHRNTDTKHYKEPLNKLANAELQRDIRYSKGDYLTAAAYGKKMKEIAKEYTHTNFAGVQNSVFNERTGTGRIISDRHDNTYKNIFNLATLLGVGAATHQAANIARKGQQVNVNLTGSKDVAQKAADGVRGDTYMQGEVAALRGNGTTTAPGYHNADKLANEWGNKAQTTITSNKISEQLKQIANAIRGNKEAAQAVQDTSSKQLGFVKNGFKYDVDHTGQLENLARYAENNEAKASMLENAAKTIEALEANSSQMATNMNNLAKKAFIGPILAGLGVLHRGASDFVNGIKEKRTNTKASGER